MQKYITCLLLCLPCGISAQEIAVMLDKMNTVYVGADNPLHVVVSDVPPERLILTPSHGEITRNTNGGYNWRLCSFDSSRAWLVLADSVRENPFDTVFFRVKRMPEPEFELSKRKGHHSQGGIGWTLTHDSSENWRFELLSFEAEFFHKKSDPVTFVNRGMRFNSDVSEHINRVIPGDKVVFFNFKWKAGCDPTVRRSDQILGFRIK